MKLTPITIRLDDDSRRIAESAIARAASGGLRLTMADVVRYALRRMGERDFQRLAKAGEEGR